MWRKVLRRVVQPGELIHELESDCSLDLEALTDRAFERLQAVSQWSSSD
jgi:hypothetical protein